MKKILFILFTWSIVINVSSAKTLNFRTEEIKEISYSYENVTENFNIYRDNETEEFLFTTSPDSKPSYQREYTITEENFPNKIKKYLEETTQVKNVNLQKYFYINTQIEIWKYYHYNVTITGQELLEEAKEFLTNTVITPTWVNSYQIKSTLELPISEDYQVNSTNCEIIPSLDKIIIKNCQASDTLQIKEQKESNIKIYQTEQPENNVIKAGTSPLSWQIELIKEEPLEEKEEQRPIEENYITTDNSDKKELREELTKTNSEKEESQKRKIENVPSTLEKEISLKWLAFLFLLIKIWRK